MDEKIQKSKHIKTQNKTMPNKVTFQKYEFPKNKLKTVGI